MIISRVLLKGGEKIMKLAVIGSFLIAILHSILFYGQKLGISVFLFCLAFCFFIICILEKNNKIKNKKALILVIPILLISATYFIFNNSFFYITNIFVLILLTAIMIVLAVFNKTTLRLISNRIVYLILGPIEFLEEAVGSIIETIVSFFKKKEVSKEKNEKARKIIIGILIAIPILIVVLSLLSSADSVFSNELGEVIQTIFDLDIFKSTTYTNLFFRIIIILLISVYLIALLYNILEDNFGEKECTEAKKWSIDKTIGNTILTILNVVYLIFCYIQISVLFMKTGNMQSYEYAEYARQGFFQLMAVSVINLIIILLTSKRNEVNKKLTYTKIMNLCLSGFTIVILISSFYRMFLYEQEYGYTFLRLMVYFALATELILIIPTIMYILDVKINLPKTYFVIIVLMYVFINYTNINSLIAKNNIDRYLSNSSKYEIDIYYLQTLGVDAYKEIERLINVEDTKIRDEVEWYLKRIENEVSDMNWQSFNINKLRAKFYN